MSTRSTRYAFSPGNFVLEFILHAARFESYMSGPKIVQLNTSGTVAGYGVISIPVWVVIKPTVGVREPPTSFPGKVGDIWCRSGSNGTEIPDRPRALADAGGTGD
ncbi:hypothetical protein FRB91_008682 [Serendipita sp. 411]|nr:hypothetical protein FRB91_008682 [Serendipita sp. 411]